MKSNQLNLTLISLALVITSLNSVSAIAQNILDVTGNHEILQDLKAQVQSCAVELVSGGKVVGFQSVCPTLRLLSQAQAQVMIEGHWYTASLAESDLSDGGDLDNMSLYNDRGAVVAARSNVPAYDQIVLAMVGGNIKLQQRALTP